MARVLRICSRRSMMSEQFPDRDDALGRYPSRAGRARRSAEEGVSPDVERGRERGAGEVTLVGTRGPRSASVSAGSLSASTGLPTCSWRQQP